MQTRRATILAFLLIVPVVVFPLARKEHQAYTLQELSGPECLDSMALALNNRRQVVGWCTTTSVPLQATLWQNGIAKRLGTLGGIRSHAAGVNDSGQIVGSADTRTGASHACVWQQGQTLDLGALGGRQSEATAINEQGQVAGWAETTQGRHHAFLWQNSRMRDLGTLGGECSEATAINDRGQVVGWAQIHGADRHAFLWENGQLQDLGTLGGRQSEATAINGCGQIVGYADTLSLARHAFRYENGIMADLDVWDDESDDLVANGINERGQVVGRCSGLHVDSNHGADAAFCLRGDRIDLLRSLLPKTPGYPLNRAIVNSAVAINGRGDIAANAISGTQCHALLVTAPF